MANNNLSRGQQTAREFGHLTIQFVQGKNPKQAIQTIVNGVTYSTSAISSYDGWRAFFEQFACTGVTTDASMASSKVEQAWGDSEIKRISNYIGQVATYVKKNNFDYNKSLTDLLDDITICYGVNSKDYLIDTNAPETLHVMGLYLPLNTYRTVVKHWLVINEKTDLIPVVDSVIKRYAELRGE